MQITFFYVMEWFQAVCMILSLLFSFRLINNPEIRNYMKGFYWYSIVAAGLAMLRFSSVQFPTPIQMAITRINNYSILFHFTFLSVFISSVLPNKQEFKYSNLFILSFFCLSLIFLLFNKTIKANSVPFAIANLGLVLYCIIYYYRLSKEPIQLNLFKEPSFWIISGIFICMSASIPINSLHEYLKGESSIDLTHRKNLFGIGYFAYGCFHLFLIKAYLCSTSPQKA
jgi:hypothetical protein